MEEFIAEILILFFILISFLFSALEKIFNWNSSIVYYKDHFKNSFIKNYIRPLLIIVIFSEIITCILGSIGTYLILKERDFKFALFTTIAATITLFALLIGQRIAKDYAGAANITIYIILTILGTFMIQLKI